MNTATIDEAGKVAKKKSARDPDAWERKPIVLQLRGSAEYRDALEELAKVDGLSLAGMADLAIRVYARHVNFTKPIPKR
jgi:hypothetical protein